ncbi:MAG: VCBS repeat-containing protein [Acidobacteriota bacterium]
MRFPGLISSLFILPIALAAFGQPLPATFARAGSMNSSAGRAHTVGDFNFDGKTDVAVVELPNNVIRIYSAPSGIFGPSVSIKSDMFFGDIASGDFNNDGSPDFVAVGQLSEPPYDRVLRVLLRNGAGTVTPGSTTLFPDPKTFGSIATVDFNHDGNLDLVVNVVEAGSIYLLQGDGRGAIDLVQGHTDTRRIEHGGSRNQNRGYGRRRFPGPCVPLVCIQLGQDWFFYRIPRRGGRPSPCQYR